MDPTKSPTPAAITRVIEGNRLTITWPGGDVRTYYVTDVPLEPGRYVPEPAPREPFGRDGAGDYPEA